MELAQARVAARLHLPEASAALRRVLNVLEESAHRWPLDTDCVLRASLRQLLTPAKTQSPLERAKDLVTIGCHTNRRQVSRVYLGGKLQRTGYLNMVYTNGENSVRLIFENLVNPDGSHVPVVITIDANRL